MNNILLYSILSTTIISLFSFIGVLILFFKESILKKITYILVAFSAGTLLGGAMLHLIPESLEQGFENVFLFTLIGFSVFYILERFLFWHHCHHQGGTCEVHTFSKMNLIGDSLHNFIDGLIIAGSFTISVPLGISTSLAILTHEIPQEFSDFGVLIHGGYTKTKALLFNFFSACFAVLGAIIGFFISNSMENFTLMLLPFAAGGFIYISASDLIPELHKQKNIKQSISSFGFFVLGISLMYFLK